MVPRKTQEKYEKLRQILQHMGSVLIGFSGGVDSTFLTYVAKDVLGDKVLAITAVSPTLPKCEETAANTLSAEMGVQHEVVHSTEFEDARFVANPPNRCYICKKIHFRALVELAQQRGYTWVADGGNVDDLGDYRPGLKALQELSQWVRSPMIEAGLTKTDIRVISKALNLPTWNKQSAACLASRIPYGVPLTAQRLTMVDQAEAFLAPYITGSLRVRYHDDIARIEVGQNEISTVVTHRKEIVNALRQCGFTYVTLDLGGYEMGSLNEIISTKEE